MKNTREAGFGHWVVLVIGIALILMLMGFFKSGGQNALTKITYKAILRIPCGLTIKGPIKDEKAKFPLKVFGYVNGCGWETRGNSAGTAQVFDGNGAPLTAQTNLIVPADSTGAPFYFENNLVLQRAPTSDSGALIIKGVTGLSHATQIKF